MALELTAEALLCNISCGGYKPHTMIATNKVEGQGLLPNRDRNGLGTSRTCCSIEAAFPHKARKGHLLSETLRLEGPVGLTQPTPPTAAAVGWVKGQSD